MISYQGDRQSIFGNFAVGVKMKAFVSKCITTSDGMNLNTIYQRTVPKYDLRSLTLTLINVLLTLQMQIIQY